MDLRRNIRKAILQEIYGKILLEQAEQAEQEGAPESGVTARDVADKAQAAVKANKPAPKPAAPAKPKNDGRFPTAEAAQQAKDLLLKNAALFGQGVKPPNGVQLSDEQARKIATDLYEATEAWSLSVSGLMSGKVGAAGTDEEAILKALKSIPTLADLSHVSQIYSEKYKGYELADTLEDEYGSFTSDEFYDVRMAVQDIYKRGLFTLGGEVITLEKLKEIASIAGKNEDALKRAQGVGAEGSDFDLAGLASGTAGAAGVGAGAVAGAGAALGVAGAFGVGGGIAAAEAGTLAAGVLGTGTASAVGYGGLAGAATLLGSIPVAGWIALGVIALGVGLFVAFDDEDFDEQELKMLSPDFYINLEKMFKELSENFKKEADGIDPSSYPSENDPAEGEEEQEGAGGASGSDEGECPPLGWGLEAPFVQNIIKTMNAYAKNKAVEGYPEAPVSDSWNGVQPSWLVFAAHALKNCALYTSFRDLDVRDWRVMSKAMRATYPGYTPNPKGCLAFCLDAYCCKLTWGNQESRGGGQGSRGRGDGKKDTAAERDKTLSGGSHEVTLNRTNQNFKKSGFRMSNKTDPDEIMLMAIISNMTAGSTRGGYPGGQISFKFNVKNGKVADVDRVSGSRLTGQLNGVRILPAIKSLKDAASSLVIPDDFKNVKDIRVTFRITGGQIDDVRARAKRV